MTQSQLPSYWLNTINLSLYKSMQFFLYKDEFMPANSQLGLKNIFNIFPFFSLIVIYTSQSITILFHTTLWLHLTNIPLFQTLHLGLHPCLLHLSWSCTCICNTWLPWRGAMSSTCSPPSPDTSDCRPPNFLHLYVLLIQPFQLYSLCGLDSERICLDLNSLHFWKNYEYIIKI